MNGHLSVIKASTLCISSNAENRKGGKQKRRQFIFEFECHEFFL